MKDSSGIEVKDASKITNSYLSADKEIFTTGETNTFHTKIKYSKSTYKPKSEGSAGKDAQNPDIHTTPDVPQTSNIVGAESGAIGSGVGTVVSTVAVTAVVSVVVVVGVNVVNNSLPSINMLETDIQMHSFQALFEPKYEKESTLTIRLGNALQKFSQTIKLQTLDETTSEEITTPTSSTTNTNTETTTTGTTDVPITDTNTETISGKEESPKQIQEVLFDNLLEDTYYTFDIVTDIGFGENNIYTKTFKTKQAPKDLTYGTIPKMTYEIKYETSLLNYSLEINDPAKYLSNITVKFTSLYDSKSVTSSYQADGINEVSLVDFTKGYTIRASVYADSSHPLDIENNKTNYLLHEEAIYY